MRSKDSAEISVSLPKALIVATRCDILMHTPYYFLQCAVPIATLVCRAHDSLAGRSINYARVGPRHAPVLGYDALWAESLKIGKRFSQYEKVRQGDVAM